MLADLNVLGVFWMNIGYIRVSKGNQQIDRQLDALNEADCEKIFVDKVSGAKSDRPELERMFEYLRAGDTVVVTELSRFGRSVKDLIVLMERLNTAGANFRSLKENALDTTTDYGKFAFLIFAAVAEFERELIVARTRDGLAAARARGRVGGRPRKDPAAVETALILYKDGKTPVREITRRTGVSKSCLYRYVKEDGKLEDADQALPG